MLSIRRRQGPYALENTSAFGGPDPGWPSWGELGPMLLRSAGIVGLAGLIMTIAAGNIFFGEPPRAASARSAVAAVDAPEAVVIAASAAPDEPAQESEPEETAAEMIVAVATAADTEAVPAEPEAAGPVEPLALAPASVVANAPAEPPPPRAGGFDGGFSLTSPSLYSPAHPMRFQVTAAAPANGEAAAAPDAEEDADPVQSVAPPAGEAEGDAEELWATEAIECPRDWFAGAGASAGEGSAECAATEVALVAAPAAPVEAAAEDPLRGTLDLAPQDAVETHDALESALATQALKLAGFVARVPKPRPDPPVRRVSSRQPSSWPSEPPPNCGKLHAYWRFTDRKAGTKEWYCR